MTEMYFPMPEIYDIIDKKEISDVLGINDFNVMQTYISALMHTAQLDGHAENAVDFFLENISILSDDLAIPILKMQLTPSTERHLSELKGVLETHEDVSYSFKPGQSKPVGFFIKGNV